MGTCHHGGLSGDPAIKPGAARNCAFASGGGAGMKRSTNASARYGTEAATQSILRHWREAVPDDRLAHLVKDATRALLRALQMRLAAHGVSIGHWTFLRILWEKDGLTQRELSEQAGL